MGKRKTAPKKADAAKRQLMTWNMTDDFRPLAIDDSEIDVDKDLVNPLIYVLVNLSLFIRPQPKRLGAYRFGVSVCLSVCPLYFSCTG